MFKVVQKVVCIKQVNWHVGFGPSKDDVLEIIDIKENIFGTFLKFSKYPTAMYGSENFRPIDEQFAEDVLTNIKEQIEKEQLV